MNLPLAHPALADAAAQLTVAVTSSPATKAARIPRRYAVQQDIGQLAKAIHALEIRAA